MTVTVKQNRWVTWASRRYWPGETLMLPAGWAENLKKQGFVE